MFFSRLKLPSPLQFPQAAHTISQKAKQIQNRLLPHGRKLAFLRKGLEGVSTTPCGTFLLVGEFVQLLNEPGDYNPREWNFRGEDRWWVRQGKRKWEKLIKGNLHGKNCERGSLPMWNLLLGLRCGVTQEHASMTVLTQNGFRGVKMSQEGKTGKLSLNRKKSVWKATLKSWYLIWQNCISHHSLLYHGLVS